MIEELYRQNIETSHTPPATAWQSIESRIKEGAAPASPNHGSLWWLVAAAAVAICAVAIPMLLPRHGNDELAELEPVDIENTVQGTAEPAADQTTEESGTAQFMATAEPSQAAQSHTPVSAEPAQAAPARTQANATESPQEQPKDFEKPASVAAAPSTAKPSAPATAVPSAPETAASEVTVQKAPAHAKSAIANTPAPPAPVLPDVPLFIPSLITPNGDGYNDVWYIEGLSALGTAEVTIYTPQGRPVYKSKNYQNDFNGHQIPDGNYIYTFQIREKNIIRRGSLVIKRR